MSIYVEILIRAPLDEIWTHTQTPELHERWDLRFSHIDYLPRASEREPQRFRYRTRVGLGIEVAGDGESVGERDLEDGSRSSALKFRSADPRSIIREGSGYWKYIPMAGGIRFLTWYDYETRFGAVGWCIDRLAFRPLMGWATAWSFDRLRLWLEEGIDPEYAARQALIHAVSRTGLAFVFAYHGLVPKLLQHHADELAMLRDAGIGESAVLPALMTLGAAELLLALSMLLFWRRRWPVALTLGLMAIATVSVAITSPRFLSAAFNPVSLNFAVACLAVIDLIALRALPSASRCRRRQTADE
jgi:DoxX-like family